MVQQRVLVDTDLWRHMATSDAIGQASNPIESFGQYYVMKGNLLESISETSRKFINREICDHRLHTLVH